MNTTTHKSTAFLIRRVIVAAREGAMQCPKCSYLLSETDALLCRVGETHYCPQCWSKIPDPAEVATHPVGDPHDATDDAGVAKDSGALPNGEAKKTGNSTKN